MKLLQHTVSRDMLAHNLLCTWYNLGILKVTYSTCRQDVRTYFMIVSVLMLCVCNSMAICPINSYAVAMSKVFIADLA